MKINGSNVTIMVKDFDKAIKFYENLGLKLIQRWENHYAMIGTTGITLGIHPAKKNKNSSGTLSIGFMIEDINEAKKLLDKHKVKYKFFDSPEALYLNFQDLDGTILYFTQPRWK